MIKKMKKLFFIILLSVLLFPVHAQIKGPILPINSGYGSGGSYSAAVDSIVNPMWPLDPIYTWVYHPSNSTGRHPVVFFCHGFGAINPIVYDAYIRHIVSLGYTVVYPAYPAIATTNFEGLYDIMFNGFCQAVSQYGEYMDTTKLGIVGHSFGAGAASSMTLRCQTKGWGNNSRFMLLHAPWYVFDVAQSQLRSFPDNCKLLVQVYEEDRTNDHRMAVDLFNTISIPASEKDFMMVYSDSSTVFNYKLQAVHGTPVANLYSIGYNCIDGLDYYGTWRLFDALADYSFNNNQSAKNVALGNGSTEQIDFGTWPSPELRPVKKPYAGDTPFAAQSEDYYQWKWSNSINPRLNNSGVKDNNIVTDYAIAQNYPNPFNPATKIAYNIPYSSSVNLLIFNSLGQLIKEFKSIKAPGSYEENFDGRGLSSGVYFYKINAVSIDGQHVFNYTKKMVMIK